MISRIINYIHKILIVNNSYSTKIKYLRSVGMKIGETTRLNCKIDAFGSEPYLITIGERCLIAEEVHFITHDGGISVLNNLNKFSGGNGLSKADIS